MTFGAYKIFKYYTESEFSNQFYSYSTSVDLSVLHMNRSRNSKVRNFCQLIHLLDYMFDVIVLSEIWAYNTDYYQNILPGYELFYKLPIDSKVGGVGIFVRNNCYSVQELNHFNIASSENCKVENLWLQVSSSSKEYIVAGIYRHPNQNISEFKCKLESELQKLSVQSTPYIIIAGDINIDLLKFIVHSGTAEFVDTLLTNNFSPIINYAITNNIKI